METVLEVLNENVVIAGDEHRILFANPRFVERTGILRQDLIGSDASHSYSSQESRQRENSAGNNRCRCHVDYNSLPVHEARPNGSPRAGRERQGPESKGYL